MSSEQRRRGRYQPPAPAKLNELKKLAGSSEMPSAYADQLADFAAGYRRTDLLPNTDFAKLNSAPKDRFRMFPAKCRRALSYASSDAKLVFLALWFQHEEKHARANGVLVASVDWLMSKLDMHNRNRTSTAILELEVRGLARVQRGRGGNGTSYPNFFQLTAFPDCLGNAPTLDYERVGLPETKMDCHEKPEQVVLLFNARIKARMEIVRYLRNMPRPKKV